MFFLDHYVLISYSKVVSVWKNQWPTWTCFLQNRLRLIDFKKKKILSWNKANFNLMYQIHTQL